jgi:SAM-dependent methyltransferase
MRNYVREIIRAGDDPLKINAFHKACMPYLAKTFFPDKNSRILELGAGSGHCILPIKDSGYGSVFAIDIDSFNFPFLVRKGIRCLQADASCGLLPFRSKSLDAVILFHLIEHLPDAEPCLSEIKRVLKEDGILVLSTPDWRRRYKTFYGDPTHVHPYDKKSVFWILNCFDFKPIWVRNFGVVRGLGRFPLLWKLFKPLMFTGLNIIAIARKISLKDNV